MSSSTVPPTDFHSRHTSPDVFHSTLTLLRSMVTVSSASNDPDGLDRVTSLLGRHLADRGLNVEIRPHEGHDGVPVPVLLARGSRSSADGLLLIGHLDTVLPAAEPRFEGGRLYGTGCVDMKGGLACFVGALDLLQKQGRAMPGDLSLLVVPDEEIAGPVCRQMVREHGATARGLWVLEPGQPTADGRGESLVVARRGLTTWSLDVQGRAAHAGNGFWQGRSALVAAAEWCHAAAELSSPGLGPTVNPGRFVSGESAFVDDLADHADLLFSPRQTNVVADRARVEGEFRCVDDEQANRLLEKLEALARDVAGSRQVEMRFEKTKRVPALRAGKQSLAWAESACRQASESGWHLEIERDRRGISFPNMLPDPSAVPTLDGLGPVGGGMHTREEFVELSSLDRRIALLADLLAADAGQLPGSRSALT